MASEKAIERVLDLLTTAPPAQLESLRAGATVHARRMRQIVRSKNVVAVGIAEKITRGKPTGQLALTFYVERKVPLHSLRASALIPPAVAEALGGPQAIPTDVVVLGRLRPEINATRNPVQPGNSIGHVKITAGTLGALVTRGNALHLLSNSHVLALGGRAKKGDPIIYPGEADSGAPPADLVAQLSGFTPFATGGAFVNHVDCAIAKPTALRRPDLVAEIKGLGLPKGTIKPRRGMRVVKVGRTSGKTTGVIRDVHFRFVLEYDRVGAVGFIDQVLCTRYTRPGDSGSLVLDRATGRAVGLHFAGANGGSVFSPIDPVLTGLGVKLVTRSLGPSRARPARKTAGKPPRKRAAKQIGAKSSGRKAAGRK